MSNDTKNRSVPSSASSTGGPASKTQELVATSSPHPSASPAPEQAVPTSPTPVNSSSLVLEQEMQKSEAPAMPSPSDNSSTSPAHEQQTQETMVTATSASNSSARKKQKRAAPEDSSSPASPSNGPTTKKQKLMATPPNLDSDNELSEQEATALAKAASKKTSKKATAAEKTGTETAATTATKTTKQPPIKSLFNAYDPKIPPIPKFNEAWGTIPMPDLNGPGPQPCPDQPPARTSNAQTVPPLFEDRKFRFQKGSRYVKSFRRGEQMSEDAPDLDQQDNLVIPLIDMRPKSRTESTPKRMPTYYVYENGIPKDWDNKQAIKALNDRRQQAIDRITRDPPWNDFEREYLVQILTDYPNASIKEIAERFNWRFKDQEYPKMTAFAWDYVSRGRTLESVRYEYLSAKHKYDTGEIPKKKETADTTPFAKDFAKAMGGNRMNVFGKREKAMDYGSEDEDDDPESKAQSATKKTKRAVADEPKAQSSKKKTMKTKRAALGDDEPKAQPPKKKAKRATPAQAAQPDEPAEPSSQQYTESDEELLALAGGYDENKHQGDAAASSDDEAFEDDDEL